MFHGRMRGERRSHHGPRGGIHEIKLCLCDCRRCGSRLGDGGGQRRAADGDAVARLRRKAAGATRRSQPSCAGISGIRPPSQAGAPASRQADSSWLLRPGRNGAIFDQPAAHARIRPEFVTAAGAADCATAISAYRHAHGLPSVRSDSRLSAVALKQARAMSFTGSVSHSASGSFEFEWLRYPNRGRRKISAPDI
jgi:hypothetical protein